MKLKIEGIAGAPGTQRVTTETGEMVEGIKEVRWSTRALERPLVTLELYAEKCDFELLGEEPEPKTENEPEET